MTPYRITVSRSAEKELRHIAFAWSDKITAAIDRLALQPRPAGCKKLRGSNQLWRIRIGDYRVVYAIDDVVRIVAIERIAHRKDAYS